MECFENTPIYALNFSKYFQEYVENKKFGKIRNSG